MIKIYSYVNFQSFEFDISLFPLLQKQKVLFLWLPEILCKCLLNLNLFKRKFEEVIY